MSTEVQFARFALVTLLMLSTAFPAGAPWDKPPETWSASDAIRVLQDSPWCPADVKIETSYTQRPIDRATGLASNATINSNNANLARGAEISRSKPLPQVPVLWWSSKIVRLAQQRLRQLGQPTGSPSETLKAGALPDFVLVIEGSAPLRILRDAKEDLHDTVFLQLPEGVPLDLLSVHFIEGSDESEARTEFHFPREIEGRPTIEPTADRVIFHCKATAKTARSGEDNTLSLRAEFHPVAMHARTLPDL